jgi:hypothetical protein
MVRTRARGSAFVLVFVLACRTGAGSDGKGGETGTSGESGSGSGSTDEESGTEDEGPRLDVAPPDLHGDTGDPPTCKVPEDDMDAVPPCKESAPVDSFDPDVQWEWHGEGAHTNAITTPLVANLTDDDENGEIDLCDVPDIVIVTNPGLANDPGRIWVFDGATGTVHWEEDLQLLFSQVPAIGDIDDDGLPEIVAGTASGQLIALEHDGTVKWTKSAPWLSPRRAALGLADLDADGDVEIYAGNGVADHEGETSWFNAEPLNFYHATTAADLDDDGDLEVIIGRSAWHHDGSPWFENPGLSESHPQVADLDDDDRPEILLSGPTGLSLLEHDGSITWQDQTPSGDPPAANNWRRPAAIHDFDGDGAAEFSVSSANTYAVYRADLSIAWSAPVADLTGVAGGTAFDFIGSGAAQAMYGDETTLFVYDDEGQVLLSVPRESRTTTEYPVVADVDNDGAAEVVVVSEQDIGGSPTVQVIRDVEERWVPARRIWNQHTYHVTNVREDGTIPQFEPPAWEGLNTFRTQAQFEGGVCKPDPEG